MTNKETAYQIVKDLVDRFEEQIESYKKADYNETLARRDFIDPFFKALGWDMDNSQGYAEAYREVIHEDKIKVGGATKAPDYSFRLPGGKRLFFVEAKKPSVLVKNDILPAYQIRRYAWSAKMPISILTDFEEFAIYDCNKKPKVDDKASIGRVKYFTYKEYLKEFDFLWDTFSKERVLKGSFDRYIISDRTKKGTSSVDKEFLASLDEWRKQIASNVALRNALYTEDDLNFVVQQLIDRIIFLRIAEDRGVEDYGRLQKLLHGNNYYQNLFAAFLEADSKYNSGLFDFKKDKLSKSVNIDNKVIKTIITELYYPVSPYEFSVLSVEILGSAYEQFLGKQIKLTTGHRATIEEKPEVRKAGGVYYTPEYIVEYIVANTIGKLVEGKKPNEVAKIKIVDPACGSGSFLLGAFQFLLNWYHSFYKPEFDRLTAISTSTGYKIKERNEAIKERNKLPLTPDGHLTTALKKEILINNIFGVDIDLQAVEVTKLSLLLKCMEGETGSSINAEMRFGERVLPTLDNNIKCGNSLIGIDYYEGKFDFESEKEKKINPFSWEKSFPEIFKQKGFDVVIGNPPYIQLAMFEWFDKDQKRYLLDKYSSSMGRMNTFGFFIEKGLDLLNTRGRLGFIVPNTILTQEYYQSLRKLILSRTHIDNIVSYEKLPFVDAVVEVTTLILSKNQGRDNTQVSFLDKEFNYLVKRVDQKIFEKTYKNQFTVNYDSSDMAIKAKLDGRCSLTFENLGEINQAIALKSDRAAHLFNSPKGSNYKPVLDGREIGRYQTNWAGMYLKYDIRTIHSCKREDIFLSEEKIFFRRVSSSLIGTIDVDKFYALNTLVVLNKKEAIKESLKFILGLFNSQVYNFYYRKFLKSSKKVFSEIQARQIGQLPFPSIVTKGDWDKHDRIVKNVELLLRLNIELKNNKSTSQIEQRIEHSEDDINQMVYELFQLTKDEITSIERANEQRS